MGELHLDFLEAAVHGKPCGHNVSAEVFRQTVIRF